MTETCTELATVTELTSPTDFLGRSTTRPAVCLNKMNTCSAVGAGKKMHGQLSSHGDPIFITQVRTRKHSHISAL